MWWYSLVSCNEESENDVQIECDFLCSLSSWEIVFSDESVTKHSNHLSRHSNHHKHKPIKKYYSAHLSHTSIHSIHWFFVSRLAMTFEKIKSKSQGYHNFTTRERRNTKFRIHNLWSSFSMTLNKTKGWNDTESLVNATFLFSKNATLLIWCAYERVFV